MIKRVLAVLFVFLFTIGTAIAQERPCFTFKTFEKKLFKQYGEKKVWLGFPSEEQKEGNTIILYENIETKSWTMMIHVSDSNLLCFVATGENSMHTTPEKDTPKKGKQL